MALDDFRCVIRFRVPFSDVDMLGHANHASYIVWAENARCAYFDEVLRASVGGAAGIIVAHVEFDYEQALDFREDVAVGCRINRLGRKSFDFVYETWSETRKLRAARGLTTVVAYDYEAKSSIAISDTWREKVTAYEVLAPSIAG